MEICVSHMLQNQMVQVGLLFVRLNIKHCSLAPSLSLSLRVLTKAIQPLPPPGSHSRVWQQAEPGDEQLLSCWSPKALPARPAPTSVPAGFFCRPLIENSPAGQPVNSFNPFLSRLPLVGLAFFIRITSLVRLHWALTSVSFFCISNL